MIYVCEDCKKSFKQKSHYDAHKNRKIKCSFDKRMQYENNFFFCDKCGQTFSTFFNLKRHKESFCKQVDNLENIDMTDINNYLIKNNLEEYVKDPSFISNLIELVKNKNEDNNPLKVINNQNLISNLNNSNNTTKTNNTLNSTINNNVNANVQNNNNILIVSPFGKEGRIKVPKKLLHCLYRNLEEGIPKLVKYIHYNDEFPQYQNIQGRGYDCSTVNVFDGENWILKRKDEAMESLIKEKKEIFDDFFDELEENKHSKLNQKIIQNYNKQSDKLDSVLNQEFYGNKPEKDAKALYKSIQTNIGIIMENERIKSKAITNK
jgi:hypothetical protein